MKGEGLDSCSCKPENTSVCQEGGSSSSEEEAGGGVLQASEDARPCCWWLRPWYGTSALQNCEATQLRC